MKELYLESNLLENKFQYSVQMHINIFNKIPLVIFTKKSSTYDSSLQYKLNTKDTYKVITVNSLISGHHRGIDFSPLVGDVRLLESLTFLTFWCLVRGSLKVLS